MPVTINFEWFRNNRKVWIPFAAIFALLIGLSTTAMSCGSSGGNAAESAGASNGFALLTANQPVPIFPTSAYRANLIEVEAIQALGSPTTTFLFPPGANASSGVKPLKVCASQGLPLAVNAELDNPLQVIGTGSNNAVTTEQADPNGVYSSPSSMGTNVLCLDAQGNPHLSYWEGDVEAETGTAVWSAADGIVDEGPSQLPVCTVVTSQGENGITKGTIYTSCHKAPQTAAWTKRWLATNLALAA
jgi:hypothetical protein